MRDYRGTGDAAFRRPPGGGANAEAPRFVPDANAGAFSPSLDLHRTGSWSSPTNASSNTRRSYARPGGAAPGLSGSMSPPFQGRAPPKRTMTVDPSEFLMRPMHGEWAEDATYGWPSLPGATAAMRANSIRTSSSTLPRVHPLSRSQTLDVDAPVTARAPHVFSSHGTFSMPGSAVGSPRMLPVDDWAPPAQGVTSAPEWTAPDLDTPWLPPRTGSGIPGTMPLHRGSALGTEVLSSSPDDDSALLHQQQNAEASVAMALGDDVMGTRTLSTSPTSISRLGAPGDAPLSPSPTERELARQMRSLTLPSDVPSGDVAARSGGLRHDTPPVTSPPSFSPRGSLRGAGRPEPFGRAPARHATLQLLDTGKPKAGAGAAAAFPVLPSGPFSAEPRSAVASPSSKYSGVFSPPFSPDLAPLARDDGAPRGMFAPGATPAAPKPSLDTPSAPLYFGTHAAASPRAPSAADGSRAAWFGAPGTLRLGDRTPDVPDIPALEPQGTAFAPYAYAPGAPAPRDVRPRAPFEAPGAPSTPAAYEPAPFSRRHASGRRNATDHRHERQRRHHGEDREHAHELGSRFELQDVRGRMVEISTDQHGSRLIQEKLDHCTQEERDLVFAELYPEARRLMTDVFGNYVIQKMLEYGSAEQVRALGEQLQGHVLTLSLGTYGCRVVQKAFEHVSAEQKVTLSRELEPYVLDCVRDQNANHVIQKVLERVPNTHLDFIASAFSGHVPVLASHCYSCRVLQRIFAFCSEAQRRPLLDEMHKDTLRLMQDQYGNYVIQWVLQHGEEHDRIAIVRQTKTHLLQLARHKFASNVVEHVIEVAPPADLADLLDELFSPVDPAEAPATLTLPESTGTKHCVATVMMQDQYANYVLQRFLQVVQGEGRQRLIATVRPALQALRQMATPVSGPGGAPYTGAIRLPGGGHIGSKPLLTIERLIDQMSHAPPERAPNSAPHATQATAHAH